MNEINRRKANGKTFTSFNHQQQQKYRHITLKHTHVSHHLSLMLIRHTNLNSRKINMKPPNTKAHHTYENRHTNKNSTMNEGGAFYLNRTYSVAD